MRVAEFLERTELRNVWCTRSHARVYLRRAEHLCDGAVHKCIDVANITVTERFRGRGEFKRLVRAIAASQEPDRYVYVENVQEERFAAYFRRTLWTESTDIGLGGTPCFYKRASEILS